MIKNKLNEAVNKIRLEVERMDFKNEDIYANYLAQTFYFVRHSTRLLALSAGLCPFELQGFHKRALDHAAEEKGHEILLINDLKAFGKNVDQFVENQSTRAFYQTQYFAIEHENPLSFLGYVLLLETLAVTLGKELCGPIEEKWGRKSSSFLRVHAEEDVDHLEKLHALIDSLPKDSHKLIEGNLVQAGMLYALMLEEIAESAQVLKAA